MERALMDRFLFGRASLSVDYFHSENLFPIFVNFVFFVGTFSVFLFYCD